MYGREERNKYFDRDYFIHNGFNLIGVAILAEIRSARLKHAIEVQLAQIKASNDSLIKRAYDKATSKEILLTEIQVLATNQKREINGLYQTLKLRSIDIWKPPATEEMKEG